jgi:hypothetical protein
MAGFGFAITGSRAAVELFTGFAVRAGAAGRVLDLIGLAALARAGGDLALRAAGFAALRGAGALRGAAFTPGFFGLAAFLAGIKFSAAYAIERRIIAPVFAGSSATNCGSPSANCVRAG